MQLEQQQFDQYRLVSLLNWGGMGDIYLAEDAKLDRQVAIKVIRTDKIQHDNDEEAKEASRLFLREAQVVAKLDHPCILPLYDVGEKYVDNMRIMYMVMPLRPEGSFADWLHKHNKGQTLAPKIVERVVRQAASALQYAHEHGIVHQDVKPSNFLIRGKTQHPTQLDLQLTDFGVAKLLTTTSDSLIIRGTPLYMAPEQWEGRTVPASDQYALAIMAYELLTGQAPFASGNHQQMWYQHNQVVPEAPSILNPNLPVELDEVLLRALSKTPRERYSSIAAFALAFRQALLNNVHTQKAVSLSDSSHISQTVIGPEWDNEPPPILQHPYSRISIKTTLFTVLACILIGTGAIAFLGTFGNPFSSANPPPALVTHKLTNTHTSTVPPNLTATHNVITSATAGANATATAQAQATANAQSTAIVAIRATAAAQTATATATATAQATATSSAYNNLTGSPSFDDHMQGNTSEPQWDVNYSSGVGGCEFTNGAYLSSVAQSQIGTFSPCYALPTNYNNFFYQLQLHIMDGDQGGVLLRGNRNSGAFYYFSIDVSGKYALDIYQNNILSATLYRGTSKYISTGYGQTNLLAVQAIGNTFALYVNKHFLTIVTDSSNTFSQGEVGVVAASATRATDVVFTEVILTTN